MANDPGRVKALFQAAIDRGDSADRRAFLDREIGDDADLRRRLDDLLAAFDRPPEVLERPLGADPDATAAVGRPVAPEPPPTVADGSTADLGAAGPGAAIDSVIAGRYKIRQAIGEGGMGTVYLAEQLKPVRRQVALKLIKRGMDSRQVLARFESERQALALMDHPNIARVLDAGSTDDGRPFFVMELVKGIPLTEFCDNHRLDLPARLALFRQICSAVQHAHQKGIIHRDLKPTNILVESHDGKPVPKVIDFGLAKATSGMQLSEHSLFTAFGSVTGTPLYMAPEQATFNALDVDTRADIYALGVILYELLAGSTPIQRDTMKRAALDEMLRVIREVEPPTPSSRISTSEALPSLAANRHVEPARLSRLVRGDLDWIVMKALAKERDRRYDSAIGLALDVERFLNHEPVSAGPPGAAYRLRKFVRRNRGRVVAASLVLLAMVGGIVGTTLGLVEANRQKGLAIAQERQTRRRLEQRDKANAILLSIFTDLDPRGGDKESLPLSARLGRSLDAATAALEGEATDDPVGVARLQMALGHSQINLGNAEKAITLTARARATFTSRLGPGHYDTIKSMNNLALAYRLAGRRDLALPLLEETLALCKAKLGPDHPGTLVATNNLAVAYENAGEPGRSLPLYEETLARQKATLGPDHPQTLTTQGNLGRAYEQLGKFDRSLPLLEETLARRKATLGPDHHDTLTSMNNLALAFLRAGRLDRALAILEETVALSKTRLGPDHPETLSAMHNLARAYKDAGRLDRALAILEETVALSKTRLGPDHPDTLGSMNNLALAFRGADRLDRAVPLLEETLTLKKGKLGPDHPDTLTTMNNLALAYKDAGRLDRALAMLEETLTLKRAKPGPDIPGLLQSMSNLAVAYHEAGRHDRALAIREEALSLSRAKLGPDHHDTIASMANMGLGYRDTGRPGEAVPLLESAYRASRKDPSLRGVGADLLVAYAHAGRADKAVALAAEMLSDARATLPAGGPRLAGFLAQTGQSLVDVGAWAEAEPLLRECLAIREKAEPEDWRTFNTRSMLGATLLDRKQFAEAEPLLRSGFEGMKARADKIPREVRDPRLRKALDRLIAFGEATGKADEVEVWKAERAKLDAPRPKPEADKK